VAVAVADAAADQHQFGAQARQPGFAAGGVRTVMAGLPDLGGSQLRMRGQQAPLAARFEVAAPHQADAPGLAGDQHQGAVVQVIARLNAALDKFL